MTLQDIFDDAAASKQMPEQDGGTAWHTRTSGFHAAAAIDSQESLTNADPYALAEEQYI